jgi:hypothetical protein
LLRRLERSSHASGGVTLAELRLPLHAEGDAWVDLARWASDAGCMGMDGMGMGWGWMGWMGMDGMGMGLVMFGQFPPFVERCEIRAGIRV